MSKSFKDAVVAADKTAMEQSIILIAKGIEKDHREQLDALDQINKYRVQIIHELKEENKKLKEQKQDMLKEIKALSTELSEIKAFNETLSFNDTQSKKIISEERAKFKELQKAYVSMTMEISKLQETLVEHDQTASRRERVRAAIIMAMRSKK